MAGRTIWWLSNGDRYSVRRRLKKVGRKNDVQDVNWGRRGAAPVPGLSAGFFGGMTEAKNGGRAPRPNQKEHLTRSRTRIHDHCTRTNRTRLFFYFIIFLFYLCKSKMRLPHL